jgi:uncharacterized protein YjbI with pentapeptide repeats
MQGMILENASFENGVLSFVNFSGANLRNANFHNALLTGAIFSSSDLTGANFSLAYLEREQLSQAILCNTTLPNGEISNRDCGRAP